MVWYLERIWPTKKIFVTCNNGLGIKWETRARRRIPSYNYMLQFNSIREQQEFKARMDKVKEEMLVTN